MELEMKILRDKVIEDEQKSGIGSLFDDEKTSHTHISLLKEKYMKLRKDFEKKAQDNAKTKLNVIGTQYILDSQIDMLKNLTNNLIDSKDEYDKTK